ncbi:type IV pilin [Halostella litorea]|uniref:type IV pilin n=1 Tax=Halostella litorea TaxID=2528831 RepID=UPI00109222C6|nr:type IV pilin N-terminal domain-containing protein [Halostella litorea]
MIGDKSLFKDDGAVSPVIGVILMVAITVILAAVIGAFVLDLGQGQEGNVNAAVQNDGGTVTLTDSGNADGVYFVSGGSKITGATGDPVKLDSVGASVDMSGNGTVQVVAYQGTADSPSNSNQVQTIDTGT